MMMMMMMMTTTTKKKKKKKQNLSYQYKGKEVLVGLVLTNEGYIL